MIETVNGWIVEEAKKLNNPFLDGAIARSAGKLLRNAPTIVTVSADGKDAWGGSNAAAAIENMLLAADSLNIGSCWIGTLRLLSSSNQADEYRKRLQVPEGYKIADGLTLGYKASDSPAAPERKTELVSYIT